MIFEQTNRLVENEVGSSATTATSSSSSSSSLSPAQLVFELDVDVSVMSSSANDFGTTMASTGVVGTNTGGRDFEAKLNQLMDEWVLVYLPSMINRIIHEGNNNPII